MAAASDLVVVVGILKQLMGFFGCMVGTWEAVPLEDCSQEITSSYAGTSQKQKVANQ